MTPSPAGRMEAATVAVKEVELAMSEFSGTEGVAQLLKTPSL